MSPQDVDAILANLKTVLQAKLTRANVSGFTADVSLTKDGTWKVELENIKTAAPASPQSSGA